MRRVCHHDSPWFLHIIVRKWSSQKNSSFGYHHKEHLTPTVWRLNCKFLHISLHISLIKRCSKLNGTYMRAYKCNSNSKDRESRTSVGSAPELDRFSDPEADPLLGQLELSDREAVRRDSASRVEIFRPRWGSASRAILQQPQTRIRFSVVSASGT